jgi:hypothetical protein
VERFKQGDVIERPPCFYAADPRFRVWGGTPDAADDPEGTGVFEIESEATFPFGVITTQSCDLNEQAQNPRQPWLKVAPVYRWDELDAGKRGLVTQHRVGYLVHLTGPRFTDGFWVADLRLEPPLEKSILVGRNPIDGFQDDRGYLRFADHLARRVGRPALSDDLIETVTAPLKRRLDRLNAGQATAFGASVVELRLETTPTRLTPTAARLLVVVRKHPVPEEIRTVLDAWWEGQQAPTAGKGVALLANKYMARGRLSDERYRRSAELDFRYLSPED